MDLTIPLNTNTNIDLSQGDLYGNRSCHKTQLENNKEANNDTETRNLIQSMLIISSTI